MGINPMRSSTLSICDTPLSRRVSPTEVTVPNPNPYRFELLFKVHVGDHLVVKLKYPDATNFEGTKVLVFGDGVTWDQIEDQGFIDPHFSESDEAIHPIARFRPDDEGVGMAIFFAKSWSGD